MQCLSHLPLEIDARQAKQTITQLDWPSGPAAALGNASRSLLWLPFDATSGASLTDGRQDSNLARIALSLPTIPATKIIEGPPPGPCSTVNRENGNVLFAPFFLFNGREHDNTWAAVDGFNGQVAGGRLKAKDHASVARLALLVFLALFTFYAATAYVNLLLTSVFGVLGPMLRLTQGFLQVVSIGFVLALFYWLFRWMMGQRKRLSDWLREPVARVESGVISLPLEQSWFSALAGTE